MIYSNITGTTAKEYAIGSGKIQEKKFVATDSDVLLKEKNGYLAKLQVSDPTLGEHAVTKSYADANYATSEQGQKADSALQEISIGTVDTTAAQAEVIAQTEGTKTTLNFKIPKGEKGDHGQNAAIADATASAVSVPNESPAAVRVSASGPDAAKVFNFEFDIPKGDKGDQGEKGIQGNPGIQGIQGPAGPNAVSGDTVVEGILSNYLLCEGNGKVSSVDRNYFFHNGRKPSKTDVGLSNVDNTADASKRVSYAQSAGKADSVDWANIAGVPAEFNPSTHIHSLKQLQRVGGEYISGGVFSSDRGNFNDARACRTAFMKGSDIDVEYTINGGAGWNSYGMTETEKSLLCTMLHGGDAALGGKLTKDAAVGNGVRITLKPSDRMCTVDTLYIWMNSNNHTIKCTIETSIGNNPTVFTPIARDIVLNPTSGCSEMILPKSTFGGAGANVHSYRVTFIVDKVADGSTRTPRLMDIRLYGDSAESSANAMMRSDHLYTWDADQNAIFPAHVRTKNNPASDDDLVRLGFAKDQYASIDQGKKADSALQEIRIGTVATSAGNASVNATTENHVTTLNFEIPKGDRGEKGDPGIQGPIGPIGPQGSIGKTGADAGFAEPSASATVLEPGNTPTVTVTATGDATQKKFTFAFGIPKGEKGDRGEKGEQGLQGLRGEKGDGFTINRSYSSIAEMENDYSNPEIPVGAFVMIASVPNDPDNSKMYRKGESKWEYVCTLAGAQGVKGDPGESAGFDSPVITAHSVSHEESPTATVQASGPDTAKVFTFDFGIPQGKPGIQGPIGEPGKTGPQGETGAAAGFGVPTNSVVTLPEGSNATAKVSASGPNTAKVFNFEFGIPQGATGDKGDKGADGAPGRDGADGAKGETGAAAGFGEITTTVKTLNPEDAATAIVEASGPDTAKAFKFAFGIPKGTKGDKGADGAPGRDGTNGADGAKGDTGAAAGFGSPTSSVTTLEAGASASAIVTAYGPDTSKVFNFAFGIPKGAKGDKGDKGTDGAQGAQGLQGPAGKTPVKGVDYFTESDKKEIASKLPHHIYVVKNTYLDSDYSESTGYISRIKVSNDLLPKENEINIVIFENIDPYSSLRTVDGVKLDNGSIVKFDNDRTFELISFYSTDIMLVLQYDSSSSNKVRVSSEFMSAGKDMQYKLACRAVQPLLTDFVKADSSAIDSDPTPNYVVKYSSTTYSAKDLPI